jgi:hypothetical protein
MTTTTVPTTIQLRPGGLVGLLLAAVALTAAVTWFATDLALDSGTDEGLRSATAEAIALDTAAAEADARVAAGAAPGVVADSPAAVVTPEELHDAWAGVYGPRILPEPALLPHVQAFGALTAEQIREAYAGLVAGGTGFTDGPTVTGSGAGTGAASITAQLPAAAGIGGAGSFIPRSSVAGYTGLIAGSTGFAG